MNWIKMVIIIIVTISIQSALTDTIKYSYQLFLLSVVVTAFFCRFPQTITISLFIFASTPFLMPGWNYSDILNWLLYGFVISFVVLVSVNKDRQHEREEQLRQSIEKKMEGQIEQIKKAKRSIVPLGNPPNLAFGSATPMEKTSMPASLF